MLLVAVVTNLVMAFRTEIWVLYSMGILGALVSAVIVGYKILRHPQLKGPFITITTLLTLGRQCQWAPW